MTLGNEIAAIAIHRGPNEAVRKAAVAAAVTLDLGVLAFFKYYDFFTDSLDRNLGLSSPALDIVLPIGISFFTFQGISYVVDVYRRDTPPAPLLDFAVYLSFFPQLVAGPIVRATEFLPELRSERVPDQVEAGRAVVLIGRGLLKKVVIADFLARAIVDDAFGTPGEYGAVDILFGIYGYAIQLYADFSGYTDMAIGIALLLGFRFPQNFDRPYAAVSVQDFWRRWHMDPLAMAARLPLLPARRQSEGPPDHLPEPADHHGARRAVARGRGHVRRLGPLPGPRDGGGAAPVGPAGRAGHTARLS